ncbi:hypothetical protein LINGRAHAP2_LOCUS31364, partial [Linum grandiflorum]
SAWARSRLALWDKRKKEAAALGKEPGWVLNNPPRGLTLNDWTIFMDYVNSDKFEKQAKQERSGDQSSRRFKTMGSIHSGAN